jgi:hypothetical protein
MQLIYSECVVHLQSDLIMMTLNYSVLLNYVTKKLSALVKLVEYENRENTGVSVQHNISAFHTNANTQSSAVCKL